MASNLATNERKVLAAAERATGMLWYELGALAYPGSVRRTINIFGNPIKQLYGRGLTLARQAVYALTERGLLRSDKEHRHYITAKGRAALKPMPKKRKQPVCRAWRYTHKFCACCDNDSFEDWRALVVGRDVWLSWERKWVKCAFGATIAVEEYTAHPDVYIALPAAQAARLNAARLRAMGRKP